MPAGNPLGYFPPQMRAALLQALGIPPTDANLGGDGYGLPNYGQEVSAEPQILAPQAPPTADPVATAMQGLEQPEVTPTAPRGINPLQQALLALADALGAKAAVLGGGPAPHYLEQLRQRREEEAKEGTARSERTRQERRQLAEAQLNVALAREGQAARRQETLEDRDFKERLEMAGLASRREELGVKITSDEQQAALDRDLRRELAKIEASRESNREDKSAWTFDESAFGQLQAMVAGETGTALEDKLSTMDPQQRTRYIATLKRSLDGFRQRAQTKRGAQIIDNYIRTEVLPILEQYEQAAGQEQLPGGPIFRPGTISPPGGAMLMAPLMRLFQGGSTPSPDLNQQILREQRRKPPL